MTAQTLPTFPSLPAPAREILDRTRTIDTRTMELTALLGLLEEREGPSPLEALREALVDIMVAQREAGDRLARIEGALRLPARPARPAGPIGSGGSATPPQPTTLPAA